MDLASMSLRRSRCDTVSGYTTDLLGVTQLRFDCVVPNTRPKSFTSGGVCACGIDCGVARGGVLEGAVETDRCEAVHSRCSETCEEHTGAQLFAFARADGAEENHSGVQIENTYMQPADADFGAGCCISRHTLV